MYFIRFFCEGLGGGEADFWNFWLRSGEGQQNERGDQTKRSLWNCFVQSNKIIDNSSQTFNGYMKMAL